MSRTLSFDRNEKIRQAMELFWKKGYEATSMQDVSEHLALNRSSIYNTFGGKHDLYLEALDHYRKAGLQTLGRQLREASTAMAGLRRAFDAVCRDAVESVDGCLMTNASVECASRDPEVRARGKESLDTMRSLFQEAVERAQREGDVPPSRDARALGRYLTNAYNGIRVTAKSNPTEAVVRDIARETLLGLQREAS